MKKVLFVNHSRFMHGAETVMFQIINSVFEQYKDNVFVCQPSQYPYVTFFVDKLLENGYNQPITLSYQNIGYGLQHSVKKILANIPAIFRICRFIKKNKIDIVFSNTSINCFGIMSAILTNRKHIWHFHEPLPNEKWNSTLRFLYRILLNYRKNTTIFISQTQQNEWQRGVGFDFNVKNSKIIYNIIKPITPIIDKLQKENNVTFGYLGSWSARKNIPFLIETFVELNKKYPQIKLILNKYEGALGEDAQQTADAITKYSRDFNIVSDFRYNNSQSFFAETDVLLLSSHAETMPLVALEAMSAERCVIMTANSGLHELFTDNVHCLYINPNDKNSLYSAMEKVLINKELRCKIAKNAYEKVKEYDFNRKFVEGFKKLMA
jgi:glycosyltransferase involved in cell wall biosynthesis